MINYPRGNEARDLTLAHIDAIPGRVLPFYEYDLTSRTVA
jgi:hypothetical protein